MATLKAVSSPQIQRALQFLKQGGLVAFPTDTLYGLGADVLNDGAVERVLRVKGRPVALGLPLLLADAEEMEEYASAVPALAWRLARAFWPGPLTLVLPRSRQVHDLISGGRPTVALRVPDHLVPRALAAGLGRPLIGTSANRHGQPDPRTAAQVREQLGSDVDLILEAVADRSVATAEPRPSGLLRQALDGGLTSGLPSTIVEVRGKEIFILRAGVLSEETVRAAASGDREGTLGGWGGE